MTKEEWLLKVREFKEDLASLINSYHPASSRYPAGHLPITAYSAELACDFVREKIKVEFESVDPNVKFDNALASGDFDTIYSLLSDTWFGVPESDSCWTIRGFGLAVDLMDDLPEEMYESDTDLAFERGYEGDC